jgi:hypothetical protein
MLQSTDFYRAAVFLISCYGREAGVRAANRARELQAAGDTGAHAIWAVLAATVREIEKQKATESAVDDGPGVPA